jgi:hypothetical protein
LVSAVDNIDSVPIVADSAEINTTQMPESETAFNPPESEIAFNPPESEIAFNPPVAIIDTYMSMKEIDNFENDTSSDQNNNHNNYIIEMSEQEMKPSADPPTEINITSSISDPQSVPILPDSSRVSESTDVRDDTIASLPKLSPTDLLTNLKIIAQVKEGEKLLRNGNILNVDNSFFQFMRRSYSGNSTVCFIEHLVTSTKQHCTCLKEELTKSDNEDLQHQLTDFTLAIGNVKDGLENLKATYKFHTDVSIRVRLDTCIEDFHRIAESNVKLALT